MAAPGLRERKKLRTRQLIADAAARLFAQRGYENVAVVDVAAAAEVSEQTVYNHFPTKKDLVLDREEDLRDRFTGLIRARAAGASPAAAIGDAALDFLAGMKDIPLDQAQGGLDYLAAVSPAVRRLCLEMIDRLADAIAVAIAESSDGVSPQVAKVQAIALAWVVQTIIDESGRRKLEGHSPTQIADELRPIVAELITSLDRWLLPTARRQTRPARQRRDGARSSEPRRR